MDRLYDAAYMRSFYDTYGTREWARLEADPTARVNFHGAGSSIVRGVVQTIRFLGVLLEPR